MQSRLFVHILKVTENGKISLYLYGSAKTFYYCSNTTFLITLTESRMLTEQKSTNLNRLLDLHRRARPRNGTYITLDNVFHVNGRTRICKGMFA